jgi:TonB-dependent starch-binding outer membrane protein SusC
MPRRERGDVARKPGGAGIFHSILPVSRRTNMSYRTCARTLLSLVAAAAVLGAASLPLAAQATGTIRGRVVEAGSLRPLNGVQVSVPGSARGALTNAAGDYLIVGVPAGEQTVRAQMIGYRTAEQAVTVAAQAQARADFELGQSAVALDELVVTGTPGATQRRALGNAVSSVNVADLQERVVNVTVTDVLRAKTPGLTIIGGSGAAGTGNNIRIRGAASLLGGNQPIFYVDGVRVSTARMGNFLTSCCSADNQQNANLLSLLNPDDIESIEVIKGPAAATLYGAEAAAGVIQIITKRGRSGQQAMQWNARIGMGQTEWGAERYTNYLICTPARIANAAAYPGCTGQSPNGMISSRPLDDPNALRTGDLRQYGLSVRGGGDGYSFYVSGDMDDEEGIFFNNFSNRRAGRANFAFFPTDRLDFTVNLGYSRQHIRLPLQGESAQSIMFSAALSEPGRLYPGTGGLGWWIMTPDISNRFDNQTRAEQTILGVTANYRPFEWFQNRLTLGFDNNSREAELFHPPGSVAPWPVEGAIFRQQPRTQVYTADYAGTLSARVTPALQSNFSFGMQLNISQNQNLYAEGRGLGSDATRTVAAAAVTAGSQSFSEIRTLGLFVQEQLSWQNRLFVTGALRMDNSSVFGSEIQRILYPKLMGSWVVSEEPFFAGTLGMVDNFRLRAAWGQAGQVPGAYAAQRTFSSSVVTLANGQTVPALAANAFGNPDLEPERGDELELGFDASFLNDRLGLEVTWYNQRMRNGLLSVSVPPSSGFSGSIIQNLLETQNRGWEVMATAVPVETPMLTWTSTLNFSTNNNKLISFGDGRDPMRFGLYNPVQQHRPGYPLGGYWGREILRDEQGFPQIGANNRPQFGDSIFYGPSTPTRHFGFANTLTLLRNVQLYALLDYAGGHYLLNVPDWRRAFLGISWDVVNPDADPRDLALMRAGFGGASVNNVPEAWIQPADFLKLRDVSLAFTLPQRFTAPVGMEQTRLVIAGHNLGTLWTRYGGLDPEINLHGDATFLRTDGFTVPQTRRISASLNVTF